MELTSIQRTHSRSRKPWTTCLGLSTVLLLALPTILSAAPTGNSFPLLGKRAPSHFIDPSIDKNDIVFEVDGGYKLSSAPINECINKIEGYPLLPDPAYKKYNVISFLEPTMVVNFYTDENCKEYEFSIVSDVQENAGDFASFKYVGEYSDIAPGVYDDHEIGKDNPPDVSGKYEPGTGNPTTPTTATTTTTTAATTPTKSDAATAPSSTKPGESGANTPGFALGVGLIGILTIAGVIGLGVMLYRKHSGSRRGDGEFMSLASGRDDYDDEVGLTGENGPHSSALMQSRVGVSFDDERYPAKYHDEDNDSDNSDDDGENVELSVYPQNTPGPAK